MPYIYSHPQSDYPQSHSSLTHRNRLPHYYSESQSIYTTIFISSPCPLESIRNEQYAICILLKMEQAYYMLLYQ